MLVSFAASCVMAPLPKLPSSTRQPTSFIDLGERLLMASGCDAESGSPSASPRLANALVMARRRFLFVTTAAPKVASGKRSVLALSRPSRSATMPPTHLLAGGRTLPA